MKTFIALLILAITASINAQNRLHYQASSNGSYSILYSNNNTALSWPVNIQSSSNLIDWNDAAFIKTSTIAPHGILIGWQYYASNSDGDSLFYRSYQTNIPPMITKQPISTNGFLGPEYRLEISAYGSSPMWYQWLRNGVLIPNATNSFFIVSNATPPNYISNSYSVTIGNAWGMMVSEQVLVVMDEVVRRYFKNKTFLYYDTNKPKNQQAIYIKFSDDGSGRYVDAHNVANNASIRGGYYYLSTNINTVIISVTNAPLISPMYWSMEFQSSIIGNYSLFVGSSNLISSGRFTNW